MSESKDNEIMKFWQEKWENNGAVWHINQVHEDLVKFFEKLTKDLGRGEGSQFKVLVPLCGMTMDIEWLLKKNCEVVGVEGVRKACQDLFKQNNWKFEEKNLSKTEEKLKNKKEEGDGEKNTMNQNEDFLLTSRDVPLKIYNCNIMDFHKYNNDKFDFVWDRGSLVAILIHQRDRYIKTMKEIYNDKFCHLIETFIFEDHDIQVPPFNIPIEKIKELFGHCYKYEKLGEKDFTEKAKRNFNKPITSCFTHLIIIENK